MSLLSGRRLDNLTEDDLQSLIEGGVPEGKTIEYKSELPGTRDEDKREFLADVSSFANTAGGHLLYGIMEIRGIPTEVCGLEGCNVDQDILRLEHLIRTSILPRISNIAIRGIATKSGRPVIALQVPRSWTSPHMVTYKGLSRFYGRSTAGKFRLDVDQLRSAFTATDAAIGRLRDFRIDRLTKILAGDLPVRLRTEAGVVLHSLPYGTTERSVRLDLKPLLQDPTAVVPMGENFSSSQRVNFDGLLAASARSEEGLVNSFHQLYWDGRLETANGHLLTPPFGGKTISGDFLEIEVVDALGKALALQERIGCTPPYFVAISLFNVKDLAMGKGRDPRPLGQTIDRPHLLVPEVLVEDPSLPAEQILRSAFDAIWNASGWRASPHYNEEGNWKLRPQQP